MNNNDQMQGYPDPEELRQAGVRLRPGGDPRSRGYDLLERFLQVPNHAMFLFTSEDRMIDHYLHDHWAALDGLSGESCDIHVSVLQLQGDEDAYTQLDEIRSIRGLATVQPVDLPALHVWSATASVTFRLAQYDSEAKLRSILREIFSSIHKAAGPIGETRVNELTVLMSRDRNPVIQSTIEVYMGSKYNISGGQQGNVGDYGHVSDFTQVWTGASSHIDLAALATELAQFRRDLTAQASKPEHFIALSEVASAENAAHEGNGPKVLQHLKEAGAWVWDVGTKIGIGVATAAAKSALGL